MHTIRIPTIVSAMLSKPWAIERSALTVLVDVVAAKATGVTYTADELLERIGADTVAKVQARRESRSRVAGGGGGVAVLTLYGPIFPRASMVDDVSGPGGTSIQGFLGDFRAALADDDVGAILIECDSPGGDVDLVPEAAEEIRRSRGRKPITAVVNTTCGSAAYFLASQADEIVSTPSGMTGSIGVWSAHEDWSKNLEAKGIDVTLISAGRYKVEGNPFEPLSGDARERFQAVVDTFYRQFVEAVAKGRGVSVKEVREGFGEGRMLTAKEALAEGLVDRIDTFENTLARQVRGDRPAMRAGSSGMDPQTATGVELADGETGILEALAPRARELFAELGEQADGELRSHLRELGLEEDAIEATVTLARDLAVERSATLEEAVAAADPANTEPAPSPVLVDGAERLLSRQAVRDAFGPVDTEEEAS